MWRSRTERAQGFTLLEMLLAIAIFAVIGVASATILQQVTKVDGVSQGAQDDLKALQLAMNLMERDFGQMIPRTSRSTATENSQALFEAAESLYESASEGMRFYRLGWLNPEGRLPRGSVQQVVYRIQDETLQRLYTLYPDPVQGEEAQVLNLLEGVISLKFSFYIEDKWQTKVDGSTFPKAVAVEMETLDMGIIERRFLLPDGYGGPSEEEPDNGSGNGSGNGSDDGTGNGSGNGTGTQGSGSGAAGEEEPE
ncbi:type II secretion system minor pseudopilin GspJ [Ferrimonas balearica]|uniref:type II secretion system minor pseudopilin GspJ n=1 Tax=Ferrimonas balearica TaxID=44012 RepID=UPI001C995610|nr:type II secretion system minor pseudopilin GspJ [Ferrimonas balearica]MBY5923521.1 type II secretion system minor pseudopilin GspJ [Ferrimonas balearica]MBY5997930.1 type II secretion system minor pseudopilin GspJ [Ferrimonas balearica]